MKIRCSVSCTAFFAIFILVASYANAQELYLEKHSFSPLENITVHFKASSNYADNAWVGIIPSHVSHGSESQNDKHDLTYQYLKRRTGGTLIFKAPAKPGTYDFRMHNTDNNGREVASVTFTVGQRSPSVQEYNGPGLRLDRTVFQPGDTVQVHFTALSNFADNAWVGIIPSHVSHGSESQNDKHDLTYQYLKKRTSGTLIFKAPAKPGSYDFRMHNTDNNGREVASVTFTVGQRSPAVQEFNGPGLRLDRTVFQPGDTVQVHFTALSNFADNAWVGIIPSHVSHGSEANNDKHDLTYQYLKRRTSGTLIFKAPSKPGTYDFRMHNTDNNGREVASVSFTVSR